MRNDRRANGFQNTDVSALQIQKGTSASGGEGLISYLKRKKKNNSFVSKHL
jgi:hypothetical protein